MISIIIPAYNEELQIADTINNLRNVNADFIGEIIVVDGGSTDRTIKVCEELDVRILTSPRKGRAAQMNFGADEAKEEVLYFLHADSFPPPDFAAGIINAVKRGYESGCFQLRFDLNHWFLNSQAWFTRFDVNAFRYGDQSLFVLRKLFVSCGGFHEDLVAFEDNEMVVRLKKLGKFAVLPGRVTTSARKYLENGIFKTQFVFYLLYFLYKLGVSQRRLIDVYRSLIKESKI